MTTSLMLVLSLALAGAEALPSARQEAPQPPSESQKGTAVIAGRVTAADTGKPLRGAVLRLVSYDVMRVARTAVADAQGRFEFAALLSGRYQLDGSAEGYQRLEYGQVQPPRLGRPIDLRSGERFASADFALPRTRAIEGRVSDKFGDPAPGIHVQIARLDFVAGRRRLMPIGSQTTSVPTDDRGHFRISGLAPGDYFVTALSGAFTQQNETGGFAATHYPGTVDLSEAKLVRVGVAGDASSVDFSLVPARMARVEGRLVDPAGQPIGRGTVFLTLSDRVSASMTMANSIGSNADGTFAFRNVPPGSYTIQGFGPPVGGSALGRSPFGYLLITVEGEDRIDATVVVKPGTSARGQIVLEPGDATPPGPRDVSIFPRPVQFDSAPMIGGGPPPSVIRDDWTFDVGNQSGLRAIIVSVSLPEWSLKRVTLDSKDVTDMPIDFSKGDVTGLEVVLTSRNPSLSGTVTTADGKPAPNYAVVIFAADTAKWTFPSRFVALGRPNQQGRYVVRGLPPEDYLAVGVPAVQGQEWQDPEYLERLRSSATSVTLSEGDARTLDLKLVPAKY
jgi:hypothetical protein